MATNIIKISVKASKVNAVDAKVDLLAVGIASDAKGLSGVAGAVNKKLAGAVADVRKVGDFKAKANSTVVLYTNGKIAAARVLLVGLGEKKKITIDTLRKASSMAANSGVSLNCKTVALCLASGAGKKFNADKLGQAITEGVSCRKCGKQSVSDF